MTSRATVRSPGPAFGNGRLTRPARSLLPLGWLGCVALNQFLESGLGADRVEVAVPGSKRTERFLAVDREPEMPDRVVCPTGEALVAGEVVEAQGGLGMNLNQLAGPVGRLGMLAGVGQRVENLPVGRFVRPSRSRPERENRGIGLLRERRPYGARAREHERAGRCVEALAVDLEDGVTADDEVELLLVVVVLRDHAIARLATRPGVDPQRRDPEVVPHRPQAAAAVRDLVDLVELRRRISVHGNLLESSPLPD